MHDGHGSQRNNEIDSAAHLNRRRFVSGTAGAAAGLAAAAAGLAAQEGTPPSPAAGRGEVITSSVEGVPDAILTPPEPFQSYEGQPGSGSDVRFSHLIYGPPVTAKENNQFWQELESRLNVTLDVEQSPVASYEEQVAVALAGGDLADLLYLLTNDGGTAAISQAIQQGAFTDLTDHLSGDALQGYPNLSRFPQEVWDQSKIGGRIYGVPQPFFQSANLTFYRDDWAKALGLSAPTNAEEQFAFLQAFREQDPDGDGAQDTWAMGVWWAHFINPMFRVPNQWRLNDDGTLTYRIETDEYRLAVAFQRRLWESGMIHPDAPTISQAEFNDLFLGGQTGAMSEGFSAWWGDTGVKENIKDVQPNVELAPIIPVGHDGGEAVVYPNPLYYGIVAIPANVGQDEERLRELLRICDYLYPPFGSEEYIFQNFGLEGVHHTVTDGGGWLLTPEGEAQIGELLWGFVDKLYIFEPGFPDHAREQQRLVEVTKPMAIQNPVQGLISETNIEQGPTLNQLISDTEDAVILGREPVEALEQLAEEWRSRGGDQIRQEFQEALANQQQ